MHTTSLRKVGGSVMLAVPPALLNILQLQPGAKCNPRPRRSKVGSKQSSKQEREWLDSKPVGRELI